MNDEYIKLFNTIVSSKTKDELQETSEDSEDSDYSESDESEEIYDFVDEDIKIIKEVIKHKNKDELSLLFDNFSKDITKKNPPRP